MKSLPVAQSLPGDWGVTSGGVTWAKTIVVTSISPGREVTSGCEVTSGGLGSSYAVTSGVWGLVEGLISGCAVTSGGLGGVTPGGVTWAKTMVVTSISHMGEMRDSDWSRPNLLRSDWLLPISTMYTTIFSSSLTPGRVKGS